MTVIQNLTETSRSWSGRFAREPHGAVRLSVSGDPYVSEPFGIALGRGPSQGTGHRDAAPVSPNGIGPWKSAPPRGAPRDEGVPAGCHA